MNVLIFKLVHVPVSLKIFDTPCKTASKEKQTQKKRNISKNRIHTFCLLQKEGSYYICFVDIVMRVKVTLSKKL